MEPTITITVTPDPVPAGQTAEILVTVDVPTGEVVTVTQPITLGGQAYTQTQTFTADPGALVFGLATVTSGTLTLLEETATSRRYQWAR